MMKISGLMTHQPMRVIGLSHLHQNGVLTWVCNETSIISPKCMKM